MRHRCNWKVLGTCTGLVVGVYYTHRRPDPVVAGQQVLTNTFHWNQIPPYFRQMYSPSSPPPQDQSMAWRLGQHLVIGSIGLVSKLLLSQLESTRVIDLDKFLTLLNDPQRTSGIITVSNHLSVWDDPVLWGVFPNSTLFSIDKMRWVLGAADICYTDIFKATFFTCGKAIPTVRGAGIYQPAVDYAIARLKQGGWIQVFPEGKVNQTGQLIRFKWGIGRMIMEAEPTVIPVWHQGMDNVRPLQGPFARLGQKVTLVFGNPIDYQPILHAWKRGELTDTEARIQLTQLTKDALSDLETRYSTQPSS
ncbi:acyltransferase-domain-containing protein [Hesseltinella vesiculosa]|uniref:Tafazzin family protein n=1 Tax=Hesseltinella vesiculosa TaxID=101127 RepID=A0A1X2G349_9FUNG|nr:acyltransferase-domain-containing protein [Hesseltinella vesiculosa]